MANQILGETIQRIHRQDKLWETIGFSNFAPRHPTNCLKFYKAKRSPIARNEFNQNQSRDFASTGLQSLLWMTPNHQGAVKGIARMFEAMRNKTSVKLVPTP